MEEPWLIWALVLFVAGLFIIVVEVLVPSGGLLGLAAMVCLVGSLFCAYKTSGLAVAVLAGIEGICVPLVIYLGFKILPRTSLGRRLILKPPGAEGSDAETAQRAVASSGDRFDELLGREGVVVTALRPSGSVDFDGRRVSVVSDGEAISDGTRVRVIHIEGNRVVVEALQTR
jgi:membrane-bound serine protease (ClpP class)